MWSFEERRKVSVRRIYHPNPKKEDEYEDYYIDIPMLDEVTFLDQKHWSHIYRHTYDNSPYTNVPGEGRRVHTKEIKKYLTNTDAESDETQSIKVERVDRVSMLDHKEPYILAEFQKPQSENTDYKRYMFYNKDPPPGQPEDPFGDESGKMHWRTHVVRYEHPDEPEYRWIDVEIIDRVSFLDQKDASQRRTFIFLHADPRVSPYGENFRITDDADPFKPYPMRVNPDVPMAPTDGQDPQAQDEEVVYRLDPFRNIVNVSFDTVEFLRYQTVVAASWGKTVYATGWQTPFVYMTKDEHGNTVVDGWGHDPTRNEGDWDYPGDGYEQMTDGDAKHGDDWVSITHIRCFHEYDPWSFGIMARSKGDDPYAKHKWAKIDYGETDEFGNPQLYDKAFEYPPTISHTDTGSGGVFNQPGKNTIKEIYLTGRKWWTYNPTSFWENIMLQRGPNMEGEVIRNRRGEVVYEENSHLPYRTGTKIDFRILGIPWSDDGIPHYPLSMTPRSKYIREVDQMPKDPVFMQYSWPGHSYTNTWTSSHWFQNGYSDADPYTWMLKHGSEIGTFTWDLEETKSGHIPDITVGPATFRYAGWQAPYALEDPQGDDEERWAQHLRNYFWRAFIIDPYIIPGFSILHLYRRVWKYEEQQ